MSGRALVFADREQAGKLLGAHLAEAPALDRPLVLGLPRGGVPVAAEVARALHAPLDVLVVRKLGAPGSPELAVGAIASGGVRVVNPSLVRRLGISEQALEHVARVEGVELARRERAYRGDRPALQLAGRTVVLVDDGLATGASMLAAVECARAAHPARLVVAVPVGAPEACDRISAAADDLVCLSAPAAFSAVGGHYRHFRQTSDEQVRRLLAGR